MLDLNRLIGIAVNCSRQHSKQIKDILVNMSIKADSDDLTIVGDKVCKGPGEFTGAIGNLHFPQTNFIQTFKDVVKVVGKLECLCKKTIFVINDNFSDEFKFNFEKMFKINESHFYNINFYVFNIGSNQSIDLNANCYSFSNIDDLNIKINEIFDGLDLCEIKLTKEHEE